MNAKVEESVEQFIEEKSFELGELLYRLKVPRADCVRYAPIGLSTIYVVSGWNHAEESIRKVRPT